MAPKKEQKKHLTLMDRLGPGFITGASDDDPSGVTTYAQTGAMFGYTQLWTALWSLPFMIAVQEMCGRIGLVTRKGLAGVMKEHRWTSFLWVSIALLLVANIVNIGADLGAMATSAEMLTGVRFHVWLVFFAFASVALQIFVPYRKYASILKYFAFTLLAYLATLLFVHVDWKATLSALFIPTIPKTEEQIMNIVAVLGTTISPYLFFWQTNEEVEDAILRGEVTKAGKELKKASKHDASRLRLDTTIGMFFSNMIMASIIVVTAVTLGANGITHIDTATDAAMAIKPLAGPLAQWLFGIGIIGIGLLALPVLAGSAAYAVCEAMGWREGLFNKWNQARRFYGLIALATIAGLFVNVGPFSPFELLYYTAVLNGLLAPPLLVIILMIGNSKEIMGEHKNTLRSNVLGVSITAIMSIAALLLILNLGKSVGAIG
jgi:NRAMP (natural resistance-associated macrophage protein)-like metal ion transporter